jgi:hypothetical protein
MTFPAVSDRIRPFPEAGTIDLGYIDRLGIDIAAVNTKDYIRVSSTVSHSITGEIISKTNNAYLIKQSNIANMISIYIESKGLTEVTNVKFIDAFI